MADDGSCSVTGGGGSYAAAPTAAGDDSAVCADEAGDGSDVAASGAGNNCVWPKLTGGIVAAAYVMSGAESVASIGYGVAEADEYGVLAGAPIGWAYA